jgi:hypothetical protein
MKDNNKNTQKSIFDNSDADFIEQLNEIGRQSLQDFKVVQSELKKDVESGLLDQQDVDEITNDFMLSLKNGFVKQAEKAEETVIVTFENNRIQLFDFIPLILSNIPVIAKRYLESKMLIKNILNERIHVLRISPDNIVGIEVISVFYITPYGSRIKIDLEHIYNVLLKIDFE